MKKRIALLSFIRNMNYGGSLQQYALEKALEIRYPNNDYVYLDYTKNQLKAMLKWLGRKILYCIIGKDDSPSWTICEYVNIVIESIKNTNSENQKKNKELFEKFWDLSNYSEPMNRKKLYTINNQFDLFIVGSDQTWNCGRVDLDTTYLLDFVNDNSKKASYAPSLSMKTIPQKYREQYKNLLSKFKNLSCREMTGATIISDMIGKRVENVLDPVFLLSADEWKKVAVKPLELEEKSQFVVCYILNESQNMLNLARVCAKNHNCDLIVISGDIEKNNNIGPGEWLWLFMNAQYCFTNSFHGTAFSILFNRPFQTEITEKDFFAQASDRIIDLLNLFLLNTRLNNREIIEEMDFTEVNKKIEKERMKSFEYLDKMMRREND